jgi:hypothetical protein
VTITELAPDGRPLLVAALRVLPTSVVLLLVGSVWQPSRPRTSWWVVDDAGGERQHPAGARLGHRRRPREPGLGHSGNRGSASATTTPSFPGLRVATGTLPAALLVVISNGRSSIARNGSAASAVRRGVVL